MDQIKSFIKQHIFYYLTCTIILLTMKLFAERADADTLRFLLAPVSCLVSLISGAPFLWEPHVGYVSHDLRFLLAASCSGMNFMMITAGMLFFSFWHRIRIHRRLRILWLPVCLIVSYLYTILTNVVRIILAIYLPHYLEKLRLIPIVLSPDTLHTLIGTGVYSSSLFILYFIIDKSLHKFTRPSLRIPLGWYIGIVWVLPFVSRILHRNFTGFGRYTIIVWGSCLLICIIAKLISVMLMQKPSN